MPRTQNQGESWHNRLNILVGRAHPGSLHLIKEFQEEEHTAEAEIKRLLLSGGFKAHHRDVFLKREELLKQAYAERDDGTLTVLQFLDAITYRLRVRNP